MAAVPPDLQELTRRLDALRGSLDIEKKRARVDLIERESAQPGFWDDQKKAQSLGKEKSQLEGAIGQFEREKARVDDAVALWELAEEANDPQTREEAKVAAADARAGLERLELTRMLSGPQDHLNAIVEINAGAGGTESQDWAQMLYRMYTRYAERKGWEVDPGDFQPGEEAGLKSVSFIARGDHAFGFFKAEVGVHRLVRISPFDSNARRHTSFASVFVYPEVDEDIEINVNPADVRIDTFRASGAGGQKVNKTDSAIRMTHIPTGIVVSMQNERSQHKNRDMAWKVLRSRLYELELRKQQAQRDKIEATKADISFGSQIRNYVLAPYRMVKDVRTGVESGNPDAVLDGELDQFIQPYLLGVRRKDRPGGSPEAEV
ncbi:MAG: peptide chain release factor 2 [Deltaproteobacteria bacterium]|nr:MAG: peptide chain release factor 2 [Deltaproteobacteria bacterium]